MKSDIELYREFLNGKHSAFEEIVIRYKNSLIYFIQGYVKNIDIAEDLMQDTFVYILANKNEYDFKYSLKTYLYTIAKCRALNYVKRNKIHEDISEIDIKDLETLEEIIFRKEKEDKIIEAVKSLKEKYREVLFLYIIEDFTYKDISKILNISMNQVKILIHRGKKMLGDILNKEDF